MLNDVLELKHSSPWGHTAMTDKPEKCVGCQSSCVFVKNIFVLAELAIL